ncbi:MAG: hypothetical protein AB7F86_14520 [Bdellovibrionales bacterium]
MGTTLLTLILFCSGPVFAKSQATWGSFEFKSPSIRYVLFESSQGAEKSYQLQMTAKGSPARTVMLNQNQFADVTAHLQSKFMSEGRVQRIRREKVSCKNWQARFSYARELVQFQLCENNLRQRHLTTSLRLFLNAYFPMSDFVASYRH